MPEGMFGAPIGVSQAEADIRAQELHSLAMGEGQVKLKQAQLALSAQEKMIQLMEQSLGQSQQGPQGQATAAMSPVAGDQSAQLADSLDMMANLAMRSGNPAQSKDFAVAGSTLRKNAAEIQKSKTASMITELNLVGSLMDGVHDEASWKQANAMYQLQTGKPTPYANLPYNPRVVDELRQGIMSAKDRALTAAAKAREKASEAVEKEREARVPLIRAQTALVQERTTALRKAGAVVKIPKAGDVKAITDLMTHEFGGSIMPEDARVLARPVAERMLEIMKSQNLTQSQAAVKAYNEARDSGQFGGIRPRTLLPGQVPAKPLDLPSDKTKLKPNMYYKGVGNWAGQTLLWTGAAFVPVGKSQGEVSPQSDDEDTSDTGDTGDSEDDGVNADAERGDYEPAVDSNG